MSSLELLMSGEQGPITSSGNGHSIPRKSEADIYLAPGALWRKIQINHSYVTVGEVLGEGAYSTVYECLFQGRRAALKMFRNATQEKACKEIEITFSMRHPNIIGIYAWMQKGSQALIQIGMVIEVADGGNLMDLYTKKRKGQRYSFHIGLDVVCGAAKGLAHMHSMPTPVVHRDIKSANIMIVNDEGAGRRVGKIADCGESRRVDLNSTMTQTGSPLWAAVSDRGKNRGVSCVYVDFCNSNGYHCIDFQQPELLAGKRYNEDVDTYSFGIVLSEIAAARLPYAKERQAYRDSGGKGVNMKMMREISQGLLKPKLESKQFRSGLAFKKRRLSDLISGSQLLSAHRCLPKSFSGT